MNGQVMPIEHFQPNRVCDSHLSFHSEQHKKHSNKGTAPKVSKG